MSVETYNNFIGGRWVPAKAGATYKITNPAKKDTVLGEFQFSSDDDAQQAIAAAADALESWAETPAPSRAAVLFRASTSSSGGPMRWHVP